MNKSKPSWVCLYFFEFAWEDFHTAIVEVKRTDVPKTAVGTKGAQPGVKDAGPPDERFQWLRIYHQRVRKFATPLRFLARGKTLDGDDYRIFASLQDKAELFLFNEERMLVDGSTYKRHDPKTLSNEYKETIGAYFKRTV